MSLHTKSSVARALLAFIKEERADKIRCELLSDTDLLDEGVLDSLFLMQLIAFIEVEFNITLDPDDVIPENFESVDRIGAIVQSRLPLGDV
jgi:acyl carrier protein